MQLSSHEQAAARRIIEQAYAEDLQNQQDLTTTALIPEAAAGSCEVVAREAGVLCGIEVARLAFAYLDSRLEVQLDLADGDPMEAGQRIATVSGCMRSILTAERTALNFLTLLSGTASLTARYVQEVAGTFVSILDTRKTLPGLRALQKFAVRCGGGVNHRMGLYDAVLIKDNHLGWWTESGNHALAAAITHARSQVPEDTIIEVEVDTIAQFESVIEAQPTIVLLDNMSLQELRDVVEIRNLRDPNVLLEASGGVSLATVRAIAETGVDRISVGALTHSVPALDIAFDWPQPCTSMP